MNLINNSCDAVAGMEKKWIKISAAKTADGVRIAVTDAGSGIAEAVAQKIFQPFFTTKEIGKGTGLGLSVSQSLIRAHGGRLSLDTGAANTSFVIELPDHENHDGSKAA